jgi:lysozyme
LTTSALIQELKLDEGFRARAYQDTKGVWTIGYGHTPADPHEVWTEDHASGQLGVDANIACEHLDHALPWWRNLDPVRQDALANMAFNLGVGVVPCEEHPEGTGLQEFQHMLAALKAGDWLHASAQALISDWAKDPPEGVGERATRIADMFRTGVRNP